MGFLKNTLGSIKSLFDDGKVADAKKKMMETLNSFTSDDSISAEEIAEINQLQKDLAISDEEMADMKIKVLENLLDKISADGTITPDEIATFNELKTGLGVDMKIDLDSDSDSEYVKEKLTDMKNFFVKVKNKGLEMGGKLVDKTKETTKKMFDDSKKEENKEDNSKSE